MNGYSRLWKQINGRWERISDLTNGGWQIRQPGTYKKNHFSNGWWGEPEVLEITEKEIEDATYTDGFGNTRVGDYGDGIYVAS